MRTTLLNCSPIKRASTRNKEGDYFQPCVRPCFHLSRQSPRLPSTSAFLSRRGNLIPHQPSLIILMILICVTRSSVAESLNRRIGEELWSVYCFAWKKSPLPSQGPPPSSNRGSFSCDLFPCASSVYGSFLTFLTFVGCRGRTISGGRS